MSKAERRYQSFGQLNSLSLLDKLGNFLSLRIISRSVKKLDESKKGHLLDLGSGFHARISSPFFREFELVSLIDVQVNSALLNEHKNIKAYGLDALVALKSIEDESVDFLLAINVLEHLDCRDEIILEIRRILKVEGKAVIQVPTWKSKKFLEPLAFRFNLVPKIEIEDHKIYFDSKSLWTLLRSGGFLPSEIRIKYRKSRLVLVAYLTK
jgi:2-polyprenyl-3-methyl-5-hydroxy-6-metoxy-1,4-benzoquinol methylase